MWWGFTWRLTKWRTRWISLLSPSRGGITKSHWLRFNKNSKEQRKDRSKMNLRCRFLFKIKATRSKRGFPLMSPSTHNQAITQKWEREKWREENIPFRCKCSSFSSLPMSLPSHPGSAMEQVGTGGGLSQGQMSSDRRPCARGSRRDEVVRFQHWTATLTFIYPQGPAAPLWQADGKPITAELHNNKKPPKYGQKSWYFAQACH